jgi:hypothetical protein
MSASRGLCKTLERALILILHSSDFLLNLL